MLQSLSRDSQSVVLIVRDTVLCSALPRAIFYGVIFCSECPVMQARPRKFPDIRSVRIRKTPTLETP